MHIYLYQSLDNTKFVLPYHGISITSLVFNLMHVSRLNNQRKKITLVTILSMTASLYMAMKGFSMHQLPSNDL